MAPRGNVSFSRNRRPYRPPWLRALNAADQALRAMGIRLAAISESSLRSRAVRRTGYDDFGDESFAEGLRVLLAAFQKNSRLTLVGRFSGQRCAAARVREASVDREGLRPAQPARSNLSGDS